MIAGAAAFWFRSDANPNVSHGAQLFLNTPEIEPTTTFEVRFDDAMVEADDVGSEAPASPLVITPSLPGKFIWLTRRSGVFTPTQSPTLATTYHFSLRAGLKTAAGEPLRARLQQRYATPAFGFEADPTWLPWDGAETNAPATPEFVLSFNEVVSTNAARSYLHFRDGAGRRVRAVVIHPHRYEFGYHGRNERPWHDRFRASLAPLPPLGNDDDPEEDPLERARLVVAPARPLPAGKGWKLVVERGLPSANGAFRTAKAEEFPIGDVLPLQVEFEAVNALNEPRRIYVSLNKHVGPDQNATNLLDWFSVEPPVARLSAAISTRYSWTPAIQLTGDFGLGTNYTVTFRKGFKTDEGFALETNLTETLSFFPMPPRTYLPAYSAEQLSSGRRAFEFLAVNCSNLTVTAKRIEPANLVHVLRGYRSYGSRVRSKAAAPLNFNVVPGQTVLSTNLPPYPPVDTAVRHAFDWSTLLGGHRHGAALIEAENRFFGEGSKYNATVAQSLVQLTDLGLLWKRSEDETFVWCFSYASGQPIADATVALVTDENQTLAEQTTDATGLARFGAVTNATWLRATKADDTHAIALSANQLSTWSWHWRQNWSWDDYGSDDAKRVLFFTERDVYSPGDTVFAKGILRAVRDGRLELPTVRPLRLRCVDSRETEVFATNFTLSALGSFDAAIPLPAGPLGSYSLRVSETNGSHVAWAAFEVAEYQPNAFSVKLTAKPAFAPGERVELPLAASYYFGKSLAAARVRWYATYTDREFQPEGFEDFKFAGSYWPRSDEENPTSNGSQRGDATLDAAGRASFTVDAAINPRYPQPKEIFARAEVTDQNQQTISESARTVLHASDFYLGARLRNSVLRTNEAVQLETIAVNSNGQPREGGLPVHATLKKVEYRTVRMQGAGESVAFRNEREEKTLVETNLATLAVQNLGTRWELVPDASPCEFIASEPGDFILELRAKDSAGRDVLTVLPFYVSAEERASFAYRDDTRLELIPNQPSYRAGDTARILVKTPVSGPALVTVERDRVLRSFNVELAGNAPSVEIPLTDGDAPNVFVSVTILRGADKTPRTSKLPEYRYGYCQLLVESRATKLDVAVRPARTDYLPGETVETTVEVKDGFAAPVADAEVTLYAVDEGVLSLTDYKSPAPHETFLRPQPIRVATGISIASLIPENPDELSFGNKGFVIGGGSGRSEVRRNFAACAFWSAALRTDAIGRVTASFKAPDNLTRFRIIAVAHTARQFGGSESRININKPVMIEPALPRFANVGDAVTLRAVVHNKSKHSGEVRVELALDEHAVGSSGSNTLHSLKLTAGASGFVEFPARFTEPGTAKWIWRATLLEPEAKPFTDAVETKLDIGWPQPLLRETHLARSAATPVNLLARVNPQLLEGRGTIHLRVANTRLVELSESVGHLLHYPYGCAEQTASALLPWLLLDDVPGVIPMKAGMTREHAARAGITRLLSMQHPSGGLGYWPGGEESRWASAYGGFVLALAPRHGLPVSSNSLERLAKYLRESLKGAESRRGDEALAEHCLALLALAALERPEPGYLEVLFRKRDELSAECRALLALAILESKGSVAMAEQLLTEAPSKRALAEGLFTCPEREIAFRLAALSRLRPRDTEVDRLATELMKSQKNGRWATTQGNAWALFALTEYARLVEGAAGPALGGLVFNGNTSAVELDRTRATAEFDFAITPGATPSLHLECERGNLFTSVTVESRSALPELPRQDRGFGVTRRYDLLDTDGRPREFKDAHVGDSVLVTLALDVHQTSHFVAVDDALPAVFEAVNPNFKTAQTSADGIATDWVSDFKQLKTDRVQFFRDHLPRGQYVIRYLARIRAPGEVAAPGAKMEEMYHPERFGFSGTGRVATKPME